MTPTTASPLILVYRFSEMRLSSSYSDNIIGVEGMEKSLRQIDPFKFETFFATEIDPL